MKSNDLKPIEDFMIFFKSRNAPNFGEYHIEFNGFDYVITVQKKDGMTPREQAEERIKELEANQVVCAAGCRERKELLESKVKINQLETHVERLQRCAKAAIDWIDSVPSDVVLPAMPGFDRDEFDAIIDETPAQSLEAVKREAWEDGSHGQKAFWEGFERGASSDNKNIRQHWEEWKEFKLLNINS